MHRRQRRPGQVGPAAARHDRPHLDGPLRRRDQRRRRAGAGAEQPDRQVPRSAWAAVSQSIATDQPPGQQIDVERGAAGSRSSTRSSSAVSRSSSSVAQLRLLQRPGDDAVARAEPAAAAAVREQHHPRGPRRQAQRALRGRTDPWRSGPRILRPRSPVLRSPCRASPRSWDRCGRASCQDGPGFVRFFSPHGRPAAPSYVVPREDKMTTRTTSTLSRRRFLVGSSYALAAAGLHGCASGPAPRAHPGFPRPARADGRPGGPEQAPGRRVAGGPRRRRGRRHRPA